MRALAGLGLACLAMAVPSCVGQEECLHLPCPIPLALTIDVTTSAGGPVPEAVAQVSGAASATVPCTGGNGGTTCRMLGYAGTYRVEVSAPGFETTVRTVTVGGITPECGCPTTFTQHLEVVLAPVR